MCAILDTNCCHEIFGNSQTVAGKRFLDWLNSHGKLVIGGKLGSELAKNSRAARLVAALRAAGKAKLVSDLVVQQEEQALTKLRILKSNDAHVVALARVTKARILYSHDENLHADFKNHQIISQPRGSVYQGQTNLLTRDACP